MADKMLLKKIEDSNGTDFQKSVWKAMCAIPKGSVVTYTELAAKIGRPSAVRAVANACGKNPFAPEVPCHRVVRTDGGLGGYSGQGGIVTKRKLLKSEGVAI